MIVALGSARARSPARESNGLRSPRIISDELFEAAQRVSRDNSKWSPRQAEPGAWLLRYLLKCGRCGVGVSCHRMRGRNGTDHRYYYCRNHDPLRARGEHRRCPERNIRADALDAFVFAQVHTVLARPDVLLAAEHAVTAHAPAPDDELLAAQLRRLTHKADAVEAERRRLADLYQAGLLAFVEVQQRAKDVDARRAALEEQRRTLTEQRGALAQDNRLRRRIAPFSQRALAALDDLDEMQRQKLLRLVVEDVRITGWQVDIRLCIPLDVDPMDTPPGTSSPDGPTLQETLSSNDRLRSVGGDHVRVVEQPIHRHTGEQGVTEQRWPFLKGSVRRQNRGAALVALANGRF